MGWTIFILPYFLCCLFIPRVSRVCQRWRSIAAEPQLWKQVDLSNLATSRVAATNALVTMLSQKRLSGVEQLNLDNWTRLTDKSVEVCSRYVCGFFCTYSLCEIPWPYQDYSTIYKLRALTVTYSRSNSFCQFWT